MFLLDWKICRRILKTTKSYRDDIFYNPETNQFECNEKSVPSGLDPDEVLECLTNLRKKNYISYKIVFGSHYIHIKPKLRRWYIVWFEAFSQRFWTGFLSGFIVSVLANLATQHVQSWLSSIIQLLKGLI